MNIIDKIKKLLALGSNNTSEEEMAAAMAKAAEADGSSGSGRMVQQEQHLLG